MGNPHWIKIGIELNFILAGLFDMYTHTRNEQHDFLSRTLKKLKETIIANKDNNAQFGGEIRVEVYWEKMIFAHLLVFLGARVVPWYPVSLS